MSIRFQHYEVPQRPDGSPWELGRGAMGVTYKAYDTNLRSPAALKVINAAYLSNDHARQRFLREARAAAQLRHPNVATIFHLGHEGVENYFYAMELIEGETFEDLVRRDGPLPAATALELTLQVTRALIAAHAIGLIHRDLKPANLMLTRQAGEPLVKVIDFGLAKAVAPENGLESADAQALTQTQGASFVGTPFYASPEQLENLPLDTRSDLYSLGVTLWFLLSGKLPFQATSFARLAAEHISRPPPFQQLAGQPECVIELLRRMLEKDPDARPQTPVELRDEILSCLRRIPADGAGASPPPTVRATPTETLLQPPAPPATCELGSLIVGTTLLGRWRLDERDGEHAFHAVDLGTGNPVAVRTLPPDALPAVRAMLEGWSHAAAQCPALLAPVEAGESPDGKSAWVTLEWAGAIVTPSLLDLIKQRGALSIGETLVLLEPIAEADRELRRHGARGAHLEPAHILLPAADEAHPLELLPRVAPVEVFPDLDAAATRGDETILSPLDTAVPSLTLGGDARSFGRLACELLGGPARNWMEPHPSRYVPLSALNEAGNVVLRRCLTATSHARHPREGYEDGVDFLAALRRSVEGNLGAAHFAPMPVAVAAREEPEPKPEVEPEVESVPAPEPEPAERPSRLVPVAMAAVLFIAAGLGLWAWLGRGPASGPAVIAGPGATPARPAASSLSGVTPFAPAAEWTNSLGMPLVPVPGAPALHAAKWPVRVGDFAAFVQAMRYDAVGGMFSVAADGRRRQSGRSWQDPGFPQTPAHPVVGVNVADAEYFCAWLTKRERDAGILPGGRRYRLPTDAEWSLLAGLREDAAAALTPEQRDAQATDAFPWGDAWPPPTSPPPGNYAGAEAGLPEADAIPGFRDAFARTSPVGTFPANALGLQDIGGNVWQWCSDRFKADATWRVVRGGSWLTSSRAAARLGARQGYNPEFRHDDIGFRCVLAGE